ncbi:hypothetical protein M0804_013305 [Polistes exclamans]|nr:hypothetical protein M0804_013305 [Polistes exclamans]
MGNPASPVLANIVMSYILKKVEGMLPFKVPFLKVYVDDIVTAIPKDGIEVTIKTFNSVNKKIQFTIEVENNKTLPFLDLKIIRKEDGSILTDWYVKPTSSGQTKQKLKKRLDQHRNDSKPRNAQKTNTTALAEHHFKTGHIFKFDETKILDKEDNWYKRNISEMYHITNNNTVNFRTDTNNLNSTYNEILKFNYHNKTRNKGYNNN